MKNTALITGASGGIGLELARIHATKGGDLILAARSEKDLMQLKAELEGKHQVQVRVFAGDLTEAGAPQRIFDALQADGITVDVLINNAGFGDFGLFHQASQKKTMAMVHLNVTALTELTHLFLPGMVQRRRGRILNVASTAAFFPGPLMSVYYATKNYVLAFSEGIADEVAEFGVTVTALCPGATATGFQAAADMEDSKLVKNMSKLPTGAEVADYGYAAMEKGKVVAVHGFANKMLVSMRRFLPKGTIRKMVRKAQERSH